MKILIAVDGSECSSEAVDTVAARSWPEDTELRVITIVEPIYYEYAYPGAYMPSLGEAQKEYYAYCNDLVYSKVAQLKKACSRNTITSKVIDGLIADSIIEEAKNWDADLLVLGSHGRRGFQKFLLGSVAEKVATHAPCSVEIIKQKESVQKSEKSKKQTAAATAKSK
jgi:nucleotide-binding universal stress UspA family protein